MQIDYDWLARANLDIGEAESAGTKSFFEDLLAPAFAFRRASGVVVDRATFIGAVTAGSKRQTTLESVAFIGEHRAVVTCIVEMQADGSLKRFHNVRLFVRDAATPWKLLAWANEPI